MIRSSIVRPQPSLALALALALPLACTKSDEGSAPEATPDAAPEAGKAGDGSAEAKAAEPDAPAKGLAQAIAEGVTAAENDTSRLNRGDALGHFVLPSPAKFLEEIRTKAAPAKAAAFLTPDTIRGLAGMQLGARAALVTHLSFEAPMGCVVLDDPATEVPVACTMGYEGGAAAVATDLGEEGKQPDAEGHVAHYRFEGQDLYLDDVDGHVVVTNHAALLPKAKDYLATNIIGRADSIRDDLEFVVYPKAVMTRYSEQVDEVLSVMRENSTPDLPRDNPLGEAFAEYTRTSMDKGFDYYREIDQFDFGLGLEDVGMVVRYGVFPSPGSTAQTATQAVSSGPLNPALAKQMPAQTWLLSASSVDWKAAWSLENTAAMRDAFVKAYAEQMGRPAEEVLTAIEAFLEQNAGLYAKDIAISVAHIPGTQGGLIVSRPLLAPARDKWQPWAERFTPEAVIGPEASKSVTWSFKADALEVDGVAVDRWTLEPGPDAKAEIAKKKDPDLAEIERRFGGLALVIDRVELSDRVLFVVAPGSQEKYIRAAMSAAKSGGTASDAGLTALLARNPESSGLMALNVAGALGWMREVLPPEASRDIPSGLGNDLGDVYFSATYGASGRQHGEMVLSQSMIEQIRALAE